MRAAEKGRFGARKESTDANSSTHSRRHRGRSWIIAGILAMMIGGVGAAFEADDAGIIGGLGFFAIIFGIVGIVGGALARRSPKIAAILELAAGILGFIAVSRFWIPAGLCLIIGALLAFLSRKHTSQQVVVP